MVNVFDPDLDTRRTPQDVRHGPVGGPQLNAQIRDFMIPNPDAKLA
jgi:hypothetical protein